MNVDINHVIEQLMIQAPGVALIVGLFYRRIATLELVVRRLDRRLDSHGIPEVPSDPPTTPPGGLVPHV